MKNVPNLSLLLSIIIFTLLISGHLAAQPVKQENNRVQLARSNTNTAPDNDDKFMKICTKICTAGHPCPPECTNLLDPWAYDSFPASVKKRSSGIDGFTFDDYLFLRWLGRDMKRHRLQ
ncbi:uncharacterized protein LOC132744592 [Ruditapes philippinarum]|uniref:uncharacterized protein LOC132744592 n=1 Tax=Ruditapes philippinarum TaxID=129788 RepID=UPI00295BC554|nr:uncharacterized protein LOC132744592 [Ruditapes philippinarum]